MISGTIVLIALLIIGTVIWSLGSVCGYACGYRKGVREQNALATIAYRAKLAAEIDAVRTREEWRTKEIKARVTHQLEEIKRLGMGAIVIAPPEPSEKVTTESGKVIEFPSISDLTNKPA